MNSDLYEIGFVARLLDVAPETLRSWERRYGVVIPDRGPRGQRLYTSDQVAALERVALEIEHGARARAAHRLLGLPERGRATVDPPQPSLLAPTVQAPEQARELATLFVGGDAPPELSFAVTTIAHELVAYAVRECRPGSTIALGFASLEAHAVVQVSYERQASKLSALRSLSRSRSVQTGLDLVDALADTWEVTHRRNETTITVEAPVAAPR